MFLFNFAREAFGGFALGWPISVALAIAIALALVLTHPFKGGMKKTHALMILPFIIPLAVDVWAMVFEHAPGGDIKRVPGWQVVGLIAISLLAIPLSVLVVVVAKGF